MADLADFADAPGAELKARGVADVPKPSSQRSS